MLRSTTTHRVGCHIEQLERLKLIYATTLSLSLSKHHSSQEKQG